MHSYGSWPAKRFHQVAHAADDIGRDCARYGRIFVAQTKEKFGTARVYVTFGFIGFHALIWPTLHWYQNWWPCQLDFWLTHKLERPIGYLLNKWQPFIYRWAYKRALKKYPKIKPEIIGGADRQDLLRGLL